MNNIDGRVITFAGNVGTRLLVTTAVSPIEYAKTLIQIGFEPLPPIAASTIFGKPALKLPNVFTYIKYIHSIDGTTGCFRGLTPRLFRTFFLSVAHTYVVDRFSEVKDKDLEKATDEEEKLRIFRKILARDLVATSTAIVVSQPFHVIGVRMMAQFVGRETKYTGVFSSLYQIYQDEGVSGLFSGLVTRLIGELCTVFFVSTVTFVVKTYIVTDDKTVQQVVTLGIDFMIKNLMYPFQVLDVCMAVNGSGLKAGSPPLMPNYSGNWLKCWSDLTSSNQAKRGSSLIWRYYNPPTIKTHFTQVPFPEIPKNR